MQYGATYWENFKKLANYLKILKYFTEGKYKEFSSLILGAEPSSAPPHF